MNASITETRDRWGPNGLNLRRALHSVFGVLSLSFLIHSSAIAQTCSIDWFTIDGGGGMSTNAQYSVSGTIGQPDAIAAMSGGNYSVTGGFWSLINVVQTPGAPTLFVSHTGNAVTVSWQNIAGWNLQQNGNLTTLAGWSASAGVTTSNGTNYLNLVNPAGNLFFRLKNP
jgi:hypothetical protein